MNPPPKVPAAIPELAHAERSTARFETANTTIDKPTKPNPASPPGRFEIRTEICAANNKPRGNAKAKPTINTSIVI
jgi:hypothetical protein